MGLPIVEMPTDEVDIQGTKVPVRGLSRSEFVDLTKRADGDAEVAEIGALALGAGVSEEEAEAWRDSAPCGDVGRLLDRISELSGMGDNQGK